MRYKFLLIRRADVTLKRFIDLVDFRSRGHSVNKGPPLNTHIARCIRKINSTVAGNKYNILNEESILCGKVVGKR